MAFLNLLGIVGVGHLDVLAAEGCDVGLIACTGALLQHFLHGFQDACGIDAMLLNLAHVGLQHVHQVEAVIVGVWSHLLFLILQVLLHVLEQSEAHVREVVHIVHRVEYAVYESLGQCSHGCHAFLPEQLVLGGVQVFECLFQAVRLLFNLILLLSDLRGSLLHDALQAQFLLEQPAHPPSHESHHTDGEQDDVERHEIPPQIDGVSHLQQQFRLGQQVSVAVAGHHLKVVVAGARVGERHLGLR